MSRQDKRSKELDERECDIAQSENRVKKTLAAAEAKNWDAERKMESADRMYNMQLELNQRYEKLQCELRNVQTEKAKKSSEIGNIRNALGIRHACNHRVSTVRNADFTLFLLFIS